MNRLERIGSSSVSGLLDTARRQPEGVLLLAAGVALLMRGVGAATHALREDSRPSRRSKTSRNQSPEQADEDEAFAQNAREYTSDIARRASRSAEHIAGYAGEFATSAADRAGRLVERTTSTARGAMGRVIDEQPLALALFGLAAGAVFAATLPKTSVEEGALAPLGKKLNNTVHKAGSRVKKSTAKAARKISEAAEERDLNAEALKRTARDVVETFGEELTSADADESGAPTPQLATDPMDPARRARPPEDERDERGGDGNSEGLGDLGQQPGAGTRGE
jgi:hypothetical protein